MLDRPKEGYLITTTENAVCRAGAAYPTQSSVIGKGGTPAASEDRRKGSPLLVNESEACRLLGGPCPKTLYNLRQAGKLRGVKIGSRILYSVAELRAFIDRESEPNLG